MGFTRMARPMGDHFDELRQAAIIEKILELAKSKGALIFGDFTLTSGAKSHYYFDGRLISLDPAGAYYVARAFLLILRGCDAQAIAGPSIGADPIVGAVALLSHQEGHPVPGLIVRKEPKGHGTGRYIEGPLIPGMRVAVVDDTCTSGKSLFHAIKAVETEGCRVVKVLAILDRHEGGGDELRRRGYDFQALLETGERGEIRPVG